jgi:hypothetical protein
VDRRAKVELFELIRREYEHGGETIRGITKKLGIHRRMVREAVLCAVPVERKTPVRERPKLEQLLAAADKTRDYALVDFMWLRGCRIVEVVGASVDSVQI